jgi:alkanesulfonate monooxygenase SsuD/methylene tetrahydromethanopterin reductase-like flavin-dependent oxidoreductase (luciferase family)
MDIAQSLTGLPLEELIPLAQKAEEVGFDQVALSDHLTRPTTYTSTYPYAGRVALQYDPTAEWPDPWVSAAAILSATTTLKVLTDVVVLPLRGLYEVANATATLTRLYEDRLVLGIGLGWMAEEFHAAERSFADRASRAEAMVPALRQLWAGKAWRPPSTSTPHRSGLHTRRPPPILFGGDSSSALRRAALLADGWIGMHYDLDGLSAIVQKLRAWRTRCDRSSEALQVAAGVTVAPTAETAEHLAEIGVTTLVTSALASRSRPAADIGQRLEALERFADRYLRR